MTMSKPMTATYTLQRPLLVEGEELKTITLREAEFGDFEDVFGIDNPMKMQRHLLARMAGLDPDCLRPMASRDMTALLKVAMPLMGNLNEEEMGDLLAGKTPSL